MALTFRAYIKEAVVTDTPTGGFIANAKQDPGLPEAACWAELRDYLKTRRVGRQAIRDALYAWREFEVARGTEA